MNIRQKTSGLLATIGLAAFACTPLNAASSTDLATYTFTPGAAAVSTANAPHVTATNWIPSTTLKTDTGFSTAGNYFIRGSAFTGGTVTDETGARTDNSWLAFSITFEEGWTATLEQLSATLMLTAVKQEGNPTAALREATWLLTVATSEDGPYTSVDNPGTIKAQDADANLTTNWTVDLTDIPLSITGGTLWFRIYEWDNSGNFADIFRISDVHLTGTVISTAVPEPSAYALLVAGAAATGLLLSRFRFRRQSV